MYIHYGSSCFVPQLFEPIKNVKRRAKPSGGLWAAKDDRRGWFEFCLDMDFPSERTDTSFTFTLRKDANVLHLSNPEDLKDLPRFKTRQPRWLREYHWPPLDFEELLRRGVDAIDVEIKNLHDHMPTWDCDSLLVLNPNVVLPCIARSAAPIVADEGR